jgi:dGTPase
LGNTRQERLERMVVDLVHNSLPSFETDTPRISMSSECFEAMMALRQWMFEHIYLCEAQMKQAGQVRRLLKSLYEFYMEHPKTLSPNLPKDEPLERRVLDYIAGMTDRFAIEAYKHNLLPGSYEPFALRTALAAAEALT